MQFYKAQQQFFKPLKAQRKMHDLIFLISETHLNFRIKLFDAVRVQLLQSERDFDTKSKRNLLPQLKLQSTMQIWGFCDFTRKKISNC